MYFLLPKINESRCELDFVNFRCVWLMTWISNRTDKTGKLHGFRASRLPNRLKSKKRQHLPLNSPCLSTVLRSDFLMWSGWGGGPCAETWVCWLQGRNMEGLQRRTRRHKCHSENRERAGLSGFRISSSIHEAEKRWNWYQNFLHNFSFICIYNSDQRVTTNHFTEPCHQRKENSTEKKAFKM